jgi:threonine synthase
MGAIIAREMGLPVKRLIISTNDNNEVPGYLQTGKYKIISPSLNCISSAMNVGHPSNLARIVALYGGIMNESGIIIKPPDLGRMQKDFFGVSVSDEITRETIVSVYKKYGVLLEPHGAVAWKGLEYFRGNEMSSGNGEQVYVSLETAHPAKFPEEIQRTLNFIPPAPVSFENLTNLDEEYLILENDYSVFANYILKNN